MNLKKIKPMFNRIITTMDTYEEDQVVNGLIIREKAKGTLKEFQKVLAVGTVVKDIKVGQLVCINPTRYAVVKHRDNSLRNDINEDTINLSYKFNTITLEGKECLILYDQDIDFIVEEYEETPNPKLLIPEKPRLITP